MKKVFIVIILGLFIFLNGCNNNNVKLEELSFVEKLNYSDNFTDHIEADEFKKLAYAANDLFVYYHNSSEVGETPEYTIKVVSEDSVQTFSIGDDLPDAFLGYDEEYNTVYYQKGTNFSYLGDATEEEVITYDLPTYLLNTRYLFNSYNIFDYLCNSIDMDNQEDRIVFFPPLKGEDLIYLIYNPNSSDIQMYNKTTQETFPLVTLKDNLRPDNVLISSRDNILFSLKDGSFAIIDKDLNLRYFLKEDRSITGYSPSTYNGINISGYPYITYNEIDGDGIKYLVSDYSFENTVFIENPMSLKYIDEDIYILSEDDRYNIYNDEDEIAYSLVLSENTQSYIIRNYNNFVIFSDYNNEFIQFYDKTTNTATKQVDGTPFYNLDNIYTYTPVENDDQLIIYNMDTDTETSLQIQSLRESKYFFINSEYFIVYDETYITLYNTTTLKTVKMDYVSKQSSTDPNGIERTVGLLARYNGEYYLIG